MSKVNLAKATGVSSPGAAAPKNEIIIFEADGVIFPNSDQGGVLIEGSFVLPSGDKMVTVYSTKSKTEASMETEGDEDSMSFKSMVKLQHPGNSKAVKEFIQFWTGKNVIVMHKACGENHYEVCGTPCAPLQLKAAKQDNNDGRFWTMSFEPFAKSGFVPKIYEGAVVIAAPFEVADLTVIPAIADNGVQYQLPSNNNGDEIGFGQVINAHGTILTIIGGGGSDPAILTPTAVSNVVGWNFKVILKGGQNWVALQGAVINFRSFQAGNDNYLIELSRG